MELNESDINELLLYLFRQRRSEADLWDDILATLHGVREAILELHPGLEKRLEELETEARNASALPKQLTLQELDDIIRRLEDARNHKREN